MDEPYQEFARLVGKVLAKRWLNRSTEQSKQPDTRSKTNKPGSPDTKATDIVKAGNVAQQ